jgi:hypothetical protein
VSDFQGAISRAKELVRVAGRPVFGRLRPRIEFIAMERLRPELDAVRGDLATLRRDVEQVTKDLDGHVKWLYDEQRRLAPHLAALEARVAAFERPGSVARLEERLEYSPDEADMVRAEHARIRARLAAVSQYEERLARLEEAVSAKPEASN